MNLKRFFLLISVLFLSFSCNDHNHENTIENHNNDHNLNFVDINHEISKLNDANHVYEENKLSIIGEYNPDYVFNKFYG